MLYEGNRAEKLTQVSGPDSKALVITLPDGETHVRLVHQQTLLDTKNRFLMFRFRLVKQQLLVVPIPEVATEIDIVY